MPNFMQSGNGTKHRFLLKQQAYQAKYVILTTEQQTDGIHYTDIIGSTYYDGFYGFTQVCML